MADMTREEAIVSVIEKIMEKRTNNLHVCVTALMSEDRLPCWHCRGIEAHKIAYVTAVKDKSGRMLNTPTDTPYNYCPACGRKLGVEG